MSTADALWTYAHTAQHAAVVVPPVCRQEMFFLAWCPVAFFGLIDALGSAMRDARERVGWGTLLANYRNVDEVVC